MTIHKHRKALKTVKKKSLKKNKKLPKLERELKKEFRDRVPDHGLRMKYYDKTIRRKLMARKPNGKMVYSKLFLTIKRKYRNDAANYKKDKEKYGKPDVILPKKLQAAPLNFALERAFDAISIKHRINGTKKQIKKFGVRRVIKQLYKQGKISFEGDAKIEFTGNATASLIRAIGAANVSEFMSVFRKNLVKEVGWARYYIRTEIDPASVLAKWK